jgi:hypothetical protein
MFTHPEKKSNDSAITTIVRNITSIEAELDKITHLTFKLRLERLVERLELEATKPQHWFVASMNLFATPTISPRSTKLGLYKRQKKQLAKQLSEYQNTLKQLTKDYVVDLSANLESYPPINPLEKLMPGTYITVGDLHGNALKLVYILIRHQLIEMGKKTYQKIAKIYNTPIPNPSNNVHYESEMETYNDNMTEFEEILFRCIRASNPNLVGKIVLIGDIIGDRGQDDGYTFPLLYYLLSKKDDHGIGFIKMIVASNHDNIALLKLFHNVDYYPNPEHAMFKRSLMNLETCINMGLIQKEGFVKVIEKHYLPNLKLIAYIEYEDEKGSSHINIFTHAPIPVLLHLQNAANYYDLKIQLDGTKKTLLHMIDSVNTKFISESKGIILSNDSPLSAFIWNRGLSGDDSPKTAKERITGPTPYLPEIYDGCIMHYHHGHDSFNNETDFSCMPNLQTKKEFFENGVAKSALDHMTNYDNDFGRDSNQGIYFTKILKEKNFRPECEQKQTLASCYRK